MQASSTSEAQSSDLFSLFIHHGGHFGMHEGRDVYMKGFFVTVYDLKRSSFDLDKLHRLVKAIGYVSWDKLWYRLPRTTIFKWIIGDEELGRMMNVLSEYQISVIHLYVQEGVADNSGRIETNKCYTPTFGTLNEVSESQLVVDLGGIDRADVDGTVTQLDVDKGRDARVDQGRDETFDEYCEKLFDDQIGENENLSEYGNSEDGHSDFGDEHAEMNDERAEMDDGLADVELADGDEEYIEARRNLRETRDEELERLLSEFVPPQIDEEEEPVSEYEDSDGDFHSGESDSDDDVAALHKSKVVYDPKCDHKTLKLEIGLRFQDGWECRRALTTYSIEKGKFVRLRRVSTKQCEARCTPPCPWKVYASVVRKNKTFCIKTYGGEHNCARHLSNKLLTSKWIARKYLNVYRQKPFWPVDDLRRDICDRYGYELPKDRLYRARYFANEMVRGTVEHHYGLIRRYLAELRRVDRECRFELLLGDDHVFKALYVGFSALVKGFKQGCRPIIGLDGCHLKTYLGGILLCAIGKDGNDQMYPIAWAIVEVENEDCWEWFIKLVVHDIGIGNGSGYTWISDQQKGLENAVKSLTPFAEHRNCARHVWMNWRKKHPGQTLKNCFMKIVRSPYPEQYKLYLDELKSESVTAYQDFISRDTHKFCKAFFSTACKSDAHTNNISETFNGYILNARGKHLIHMCEEIRCNLMSRQVKLKEALTRVSDRICPKIREKLEEARLESANCSAKVALYEKFEVHHYENKYVVSLLSRTCTCREWELSGIPCPHAIAACSFNGADPVVYVHDYYTVEKCMQAYEHGLEPINGEKMWPEVSGFIVKPPRVRKMPGRPKKKRIRSAGEPNPRNPRKMSQKGMPMHCSCGATS